MILATIDPYILAFSAVTVFVTVFMGFWSAKKSKTAGDFFVAGRSVSVGWNASAISGEYLSAASFMGIAGMVMSSGYDALWYPVCYACGYLFLLLFIAGPLRRFGAYTIPDFAEGRYDSPLFRKIAVCFVLFIGFFYTMPQMKGAGVTLAYIFPGLPYWVGVVLVGAVITLNVALGGMKGITLVQAFQYWAKMFAISVPIFVLMAVYGNYGKQLNENISGRSVAATFDSKHKFGEEKLSLLLGKLTSPVSFPERQELREPGGFNYENVRIDGAARGYIKVTGRDVILSDELEEVRFSYKNQIPLTGEQIGDEIEKQLRKLNIAVVKFKDVAAVFVPLTIEPETIRYLTEFDGRTGQTISDLRKPLPEKAPADSTWLSLSQARGAATNQIAVSTSMSLAAVNGWVTLNSPRIVSRAEERLKAFFGQGQHYSVSNAKLVSVLLEYTELSGRTVIVHTNLGLTRMLGPQELNWNDWGKTLAQIEQFLGTNGVALRTESANTVRAMTPEQADLWDQQTQVIIRRALPEKAPADSAWLSPFGPLTTKAAKAAAANLVRPDWSKRDWLYEPNPVNRQTPDWILGLERMVKGSKDNVKPTSRVTYGTGEAGKPLSEICIVIQSWAQLTHVRCETNLLTKNIVFISDKIQSPNELVASLEDSLSKQGVTLIHASPKEWWAVSSDTAKSWLKPLDTKPYSLLYTYSLIIALVCGTAGLPHILVRFYTNPDGVAAKRTTMWVMILIGIFYVFPPVFGVMGRNLMPELYNGLTGVKGTDGIVLKLPTILREKYGALGSILSGVTCAGAFAAFMSTFSGLLVSMTGALAHDVYGRMLRPKSTSENRLRAFKICAVLIGGIAIVLGCFVEPLEINFMVGQAFAIAAASYFPLLFMSVWWRGMTMRGAAVGMLTGGLCALFAVTLTNFSNLALDKGPMGRIFAGFAPLNDYWSHHPLLRILCEQPAIWTVPLAIGLMIVVGKLTRRDVPSDVRMKMLVLHAPEKLGLKQEYIQEHQPGH